MHTVTITFPTAELAEWFAKMATISVAMQQRLCGASAGILQDSLAKAVSVGQPVAGCDAPPAVAAPAKPRRRRKKVLVCESCGSTNDDVVETTCPYAADVYNDPNVPAVLCKSCYSNRCDDI